VVLDVKLDKGDDLNAVLDFAQWVISLNLVLAGLRLGLKNRQVGEKWVADDCSYLCKALYLHLSLHPIKYRLVPT
jgi:hypothetical protein